mmetsp:Transcript_22920/g.56478  ORF Transcript_22920/g.56478 Transcript_22920/m.56478 type:complete len:203 (+) Transcript_22920:611-1219(+)
MAKPAFSLLDIFLAVWCEPLVMILTGPTGALAKALTASVADLTSWPAIFKTCRPTERLVFAAALPSTAFNATIPFLEAKVSPLLLFFLSFLSIHVIELFNPSLIGSSKDNAFLTTGLTSVVTSVGTTASGTLTSFLGSSTSSVETTASSILAFSIDLASTAPFFSCFLTTTKTVSHASFTLFVKSVSNAISKVNNKDSPTVL